MKELKNKIKEVKEILQNKMSEEDKKVWIKKLNELKIKYSNAMENEKLFAEYESYKRS